MLVQPRIRGFICVTAHPAGCARHVQQQIDHVRTRSLIEGPRNVLVIGASTGYGLASRIVAAFGCRASTIGVFFERAGDGRRTATAGWYNSAAFERKAADAGLYAKSVNGDAFADETKQRTIDLIKRDLGKVDLVIYSLASPRRTHPKTGETFRSVLKPIGKPYENKTVDIHSGEVTTMRIEPATEEEITHTIAVMGGEDWRMWMDALQQAHVLVPDVTTVAYSYIGPELTFPIYRHGAIGQAKNDLEETALRMQQQFAASGARAYVSVNKAVVTQSSAAIPVVPLYISLLFKVMKARSIHEDCVEQIYRLFHDFLYAAETRVDAYGRIRIDDLEMQPEVQQEVASLWGQVTTDNLESLSDIQGYREDFMRLFGFGLPGVDYKADVDPVVALG